MRVQKRARDYDCIKVFILLTQSAFHIVWRVASKSARARNVLCIALWESLFVTRTCSRARDFVDSWPRVCVYVIDRVIGESLYNSKVLLVS